MPGGLGEREPPDPIPNSEVKPLSADGSVGVTHVRVGHRQAFYPKPLMREHQGFLFARRIFSKPLRSAYSLDGP